MGTVKNFFMAVNEIDETPKLKEYLDSHGTVTIQDIIETKGIANTAERAKLLEKRHSGEISQKELCRAAKELKAKEQAKIDNRYEIHVMVGFSEIKITGELHGFTQLGKFEKTAKKVLEYLQADTSPFRIIVEHKQSNTSP